MLNTRIVLKQFGVKNEKILSALCLLALSTTAHAGLVIADDFNDGVINGWTAQTGSFTETGDELGGSNISLITQDSQTGSQIAVDANVNNGGYVALVLNYLNISNNLFVKIQDNNGNGLFDRVYFYHGNNGGSAT